jgi:thymidylate kinase
MRPLLIAIEGLNAAGKTTTATLLSQLDGIVRMPSVPSEYTMLRRQFTGRDQIDARFLCFLSAVSMAGTRIRHRLDAGQHVVADSYYARAVAFHRGMGSSVSVSIPGLLMPDVMFRLICSPAVRAQRQRTRGGSRDEWDDLAEAHAGDIEREYRGFPAHVIDTTELTPQQVTTALLRHRLDGECSCEDTQPVAGHPDILSALPGGTATALGADGLRGGCLRREIRHPASAPGLPGSGHRT